MRKLLFLIIAIVLCDTSAYAEIKTVAYKSEGITYMTVEGNFDRGVLVDGDISISTDYRSILISGKYENGQINGTLGRFIKISGSISNNEHGGISKKCKPHDWKCNLKTKAVYRIMYNSERRTVPLTFETSPITINIPEGSNKYFGGELENAVKDIKNEIKQKFEDGYYYTTITFPGGLIYDGFISNYSRRYIVATGKPAKLTWPNGDTFDGTLANEVDKYHFFPDCGTIKYHDGSIFEYRYNSYYYKDDQGFEKFKIGDNGLCVSPSEMRGSFENTIKEREEERIREEEERRAAELQAKQEKIAARKNELIRKYGQRYGMAVFNKTPQVGMTIQMVQDMHPNERGRITRYVSDGREKTILSYGGGTMFFGVGGYATSDKFEYTFVNGRLTEFYTQDGDAALPLPL